MGNTDYPQDGSVAEKLVWKVENGRIGLPAVVHVTGWVLCQAISIKGSAIIMTTIDLENAQTESRTEEATRSSNSSGRVNVIERMSGASKRPSTIELDDDAEEDEEETLMDRRKRRQVLASVDINVSPECNGSQ
ncbi:hypothetical protein BGZ70_005489 [Mortierella alpina]|uniref:Uncharacterized protein n=1 Tax=Mortierella alpina TaxID=64518 RepID=A0A9P6IQ12_MORAP|nr:hypothetical protein BGZ70_005489 [Mortierella alpina]